MLIEYTNRVLGSEGKCIALSHARRFGKSQAAGMIDAYYSRGSNSKHQFESLELATTPEWDKYLKQIYGNYMALPPENQRQSHSLDAYWIGTEPLNID